jgi:hypothetical protein
VQERILCSHETDALPELSDREEMTGTPPNQFHKVHFADFGVSEPFVARLVIGLSEILQATPLVNRDEIKGAIVELAMHSVGQAFLSLRELRAIAADPNVPHLTKTKAADEMYKCLWAAYKDRLQTAAKLIGFDIGFLYQNDSKFEEGCLEFMRKYPNVSSDLISRMRGYRSTWQPKLAAFRNDYTEHKTLDARAIAEFHNLAFAERMFEHVWVAAEELLFFMIAAHLPRFFGYVEIPVSERDPIKPLRFRPVLVGVSLPEPKP